jgi:DNA mismatch endonuclease (patch repair protein)
MFRCDPSYVVAEDRPVDPATKRRMSAQRSRNTDIEVRLRSILHRRGLRFRLHRKPVAGLRREADLVFVTSRVAVMVDGCFWHGCPDHGTWPRTNAQWWRQKIEANVERDRDTDRRLSTAGWTVVRIWEHDDPVLAADRLEAILGVSRLTGQNSS